MVQLLLAGLILLVLAAISWHFNSRPRHDAFAAVPDTLRTLAASVVLFGVGGFGVVRLLLPSPLRRYEPLWILPTGACAVGLALTLLGFAAVPYHVALVAVLVAGLALAAWAVRRNGWPELSLGRLGWPVYLAIVVLTVALIPMLFVQHYAAPVGTGSDAHVATGSAELLKHVYPTGTDITQPINQIPPTWKSKFPIYYAFAGVSSLSGLATWQVLAPLAAIAVGHVGDRLLPRRPRPVRCSAGDRAGGDGPGRARPHGAVHRAQPVLQPDVGLLRHALHAGARLVGGAAGPGPACSPGDAGAAHPVRADPGVCVSAGGADTRRADRGVRVARAPAADRCRRGCVPAGRSVSGPSQPAVDRPCRAAAGRPGGRGRTEAEGGDHRARARPVPRGLGRRSRATSSPSTTSSRCRIR